MADTSDLFSQFINEDLRDVITIDDEIGIGEYSPPVHESFSRMLAVSEKSVYYRNLMTDQQRAIPCDPDAAPQRLFQRAEIEP
jgi:hypothetical protein